MPTRNVSLSEHYDSFIAAGIEAGRYSNASEAVRAALRLLEKQEQEDTARLNWLRGVAQDSVAALDRGEGIELNSADDIDSFVNEAVAAARAARAAPRA